MTITRSKAVSLILQGIQICHKKWDGPPTLKIYFDYERCQIVLTDDDGSSIYEGPRAVESLMRFKDGYKIYRPPARMVKKKFKRYVPLFLKKPGDGSCSYHIGGTYATREEVQDIKRNPLIKGHHELIGVSEVWIEFEIDEIIANTVTE